MTGLNYWLAVMSLGILLLTAQVTVLSSFIIYSSASVVLELEHVNFRYGF